MLSAATQVGVLYVMVICGYVCDKVGIFSEKTARKTVELLLYIIVPCTIVNSFVQIEMNEDTVKMFFISFAIATATHIIGIVLNAPFFRKKNDENNAIFKFASVYGNVGFMALPLAQAILGDEGVFYCASGVIIYNILNFTHGIIVMSKKQEKLDFKKIVINPGVISVAIGLPVFLLEIQLPYVISEPIKMLSALNTPVAMLIFGTYLSHTDLKSMFLEKKIYLTAVFKLIFMPLTCLFVYRLCGISGTLLTAAIITASVPSGNNTFMFASKYDRDVTMASKTVALVSFLSILTMPAMIALTQM